jgi:hypothetical protein
MTKEGSLFRWGVVGDSQSKVDPLALSIICCQSGARSVMHDPAAAAAPQPHPRN